MVKFKISDCSLSVGRSYFDVYSFKNMNYFYYNVAANRVTWGPGLLNVFYDLNQYFFFSELSAAVSCVICKQEESREKRK